MMMPFQSVNRLLRLGNGSMITIIYLPMFYLKGLHRDVRNGLSNRFPLCCTLHYSLDMFFGWNPGRKRGATRLKTNVKFVPCIFHLMIKGWTPSDGKIDEERLGLRIIFSTVIPDSLGLRTNTVRDTENRQIRKAI